MDIYAQNILDRYKKPFYREREIDAQISHSEANHYCGDKVGIKIELNNGKVKEYSWYGNGCAISMAAADMLGDLIQNLNTEETLKLNKEEVYEMLGIDISVRRSKCALLALLAIQNGILENKGLQRISWSDYYI